jgi:nucleotide-binding universal stress UspA family protein
MKVLVAVDGSERSLDAVRSLVGRVGWYRDPLDVQLVYVNPPMPYEGRVASVVGREQIERYQREEGEAALGGAKQLLDAAGIRHAEHILIGPVPETLVKEANALKCDMILIGTHGRTAAGNILLGSVANKVLHLATVPVLLVR